MIRRFLKIAALLIIFLAITGTTAYLTLTLIIKSEDTVIVPDLVGKDVVYSLEILTELGLNTKISGSEYDDQYPKNHVLTQVPLPGSEIKQGRDIRLLLSKGSRVVNMPNVTGLSVRQAHLVIEKSGLCIGHDTYVHDQTMTDRNEVLSQTPSVGNPVNRGECVNLLVSMGPRPRNYQMIDLAGLSIDEAVVIIEQSHLQVGKFQYEYRKDKPDNVIIGQVPRWGYRISEASPVDLIINRRPGKNTQSDFNSMQRSGFFSHKLGFGFIKKHIQVRLDALGVSSEIYNGFMSPNEELWLLIPTHNIATLFLYEDGELIRTRVYN